MYEAELKRYCREAKPYLFCNRAYRKEFAEYIMDSAQDYLANRPDASYWDLRCMLGEPEEAAEYFMDSLPTGTKTRFKRFHRRIQFVVHAVAFALFAVLLMAVFLLVARERIYQIGIEEFRAKTSQSLYTPEMIREICRRQAEEEAQKAAEAAEKRMEAEKLAIDKAVMEE